MRIPFSKIISNLAKYFPKKTIFDRNFFGKKLALKRMSHDGTVISGQRPVNEPFYQKKQVDTFPANKM